MLHGAVAGASHEGEGVRCQNGWSAQAQPDLHPRHVLWHPGDRLDLPQ